VLGSDRPKKSHSKKPELQKRPEGMARELYNLLYSDNKDAPPLVPSETTVSTDKGYKMKAKLGMRKVRSWKWMAFTNAARKDGLVLYHWRRAAGESKDYPFARFNKKLEIPSFSEAEYQNHLVVEGWSREETDHLLDLCSRMDLRFPIIQDRWDRQTFKIERSIEDLKERYYGICEKLETLHADPSKAASKSFLFDADHERRRKEQLNRLYNRTPEQVEEEEMLRAELKKIEARKKEREKKTQDLQKLILQADTTASKSPTSAASDKKKSVKKTIATPTTPGAEKRKQERLSLSEPGSLESSGIKFPDLKASGVSLRSQRMKLPPQVGQKKSKAIDQMLGEMGVESNPIPTEDICSEFNELRSDLVLLYELKHALSACELELHSLKGQYEALCPGKSLEIPDRLKAKIGGERVKNISDVVDVLGNGPVPPVRKRKAALEQSNVLKKIKNKQF